MEAPFHEQLDDGAPWDFDGARDPMHLPCGEGRQPHRARGQSIPLMLYAAFTDTVAILIQDTNLVGLRAPINPYKPLVGEGMSRRFMPVISMIRRYHYSISSLSYLPWSVFGPILALA